MAYVRDDSCSPLPKGGKKTISEENTGEKNVKAPPSDAFKECDAARLVEDFVPGDQGRSLSFLMSLAGLVRRCMEHGYYERFLMEKWRMVVEGFIIKA